MENRIAELRKMRGLNKSDLARLADTSPGMIRMLENGERNLTLRWMERIGKALDVAPEELISDGEPRPQALTELDEEVSGLLWAEIAALHKKNNVVLRASEMGMVFARTMNMFQRHQKAGLDKESAIKAALVPLEIDLAKLRAKAV